MKQEKFLTVFAAIAATLALGMSAFAQSSATTNPVGVVVVRCLSGSDTRVAIPFHQTPIYIGNVSGTPSVNGNNLSFTVTGSPGWTVNAYAGTHYARITSGAKEGFYYDVVSNTADQLTLNLNGDTNGVAGGDSLILIEHWKLDTLFPPATQNTFVVSLGTLVFQRRSEMHIPSEAPGINKPRAAAYFLLSTGWKEDKAGYPDAGSAIIRPHQSFIVRNYAMNPTTEMRATGYVDCERNVIPLATRSGAMQDDPIALMRPVPMTLAESGLLESGFVPSVGHLVFQRRDEIKTWNNNIAAMNKLSSATYYAVGTTWYREAGQTASNPIANDEEAFRPGEGFMIRKTVSDGLTDFWTNDPNY